MDTEIKRFVLEVLLLLSAIFLTGLSIVAAISITTQSLDAIYNRDLLGLLGLSFDIGVLSFCTYQGVLGIHQIWSKWSNETSD